MTVSPQLLAILVCPTCKGPLTPNEGQERLECHRCGVAYPIRDGIPIMLIDEARPL